MKNEYKVIKKPIKYYDTDKIFIYRELPICIVVAVDTEETFVKIERSIKEQEYGRKKIVKLETKRKNGYY